MVGNGRLPAWFAALRTKGKLPDPANENVKPSRKRRGSDDTRRGSVLNWPRYGGDGDRGKGSGVGYRFC